MSEIDDLRKDKQRLWDERNKAIDELSNARLAIWVILRDENLPTPISLDDAVRQVVKEKAALTAEVERLKEEKLGFKAMWDKECKENEALREMNLRTSGGLMNSPHSRRRTGS